RIVDGFTDIVAEFADRPYAMFGHSLGAVLAFEVARRARDRNLAAPAHLFVSGSYAPQLPRTLPPLRFIDGDMAFLEAVGAEDGGGRRIVLGRADLRLPIVPALRADIALTETYAYRPAPPLDCPLTAYSGDADPIVPSDRLVPWREQTTADFSC